ncbi:diacylglycerol kinase eta isoform X3 [Contarinia nasturtii]|nr:diacylglycerol kinase eta isoform X3 [Contarinia nasturtii]XP_031629107.1 diacylglycerol kinase eta isoform X3 [Contarinia nasturtii]
MEEWLTALKAASLREYFEPGLTDTQDFLSNHHHWYIYIYHRPTYCNVCRDLITSHGLSCEVCKCKAHKRCAAKAIANCKWTTLATVGREIIEDVDGNIIMPHQWMEGNLPVSSTCMICKKTCGSVLRLQDWRCLWCRATVHTACRPFVKQRCPLGSAQLSVIPPTSVHSIGIDEAWDVVKPNGSYSPLLVFVNSKSGDNQGVKFLRRFKQILNPAQVFDLVSAGPGLGLRLFRHFEPFRILVCSGDGSVGWVLSEIDRMDLIKKCQLAVLPLGTGNDLARVLGWGSSCDDDAHLPQILERYEKASTKMLDRWSIMVFEKEIESATPNPAERPRRMSTISNPSESLLLDFVDTVNSHLSQIVDTDDFNMVIYSAKHLCDTIYKLLSRVAGNNLTDDQMQEKCDLLREKLDMLLDALKEENELTQSNVELARTLNDMTQQNNSFGEILKASPANGNITPPPTVTHERRISFSFSKGSNVKTEKDKYNSKERRNSRYYVRNGDKEAIQTRANSLKLAINMLMEHSGLYDHKPRHGSRKHSLAALNIPANISSTNESLTNPSPPPPPSIIEPSQSSYQTHLNADETTIVSNLSPLPDQRRSSMDEYFFSPVSLPVPKQFADAASRRSSGVPEPIQEEEGNGHSIDIDTKQNIETEYNYDVGYLCNSDDTNCESAVPYEVYERNLLRATTMHNTNSIEKDTLFTIKESMVNSMKQTQSISTLQVPTISMSDVDMMERNPIITETTISADNVYMSENMTIIDTDHVEQSISDENLAEASDVLSAISNEECSVTSEILDKTSSGNSQQSQSNIHAAEIIQNLESDRLGHIDSPEDDELTSDVTEPFHGESLLEDISSVLSPDLLGLIQDSTITEDTTTLCGDKPPRRKLSSKKKMTSISATYKTNEPLVEREDSLENSNENPLQFGFENIVFEMDNRCDDQKACEPVRYCSLAQFVEGNDIARTSFKRPNRNKVDSTATIETDNVDGSQTTSITVTNEQLARPQNEQEHDEKPHQTLIKQQPLVSSMAKNKSSAIKVQIQGSLSNLNGHTNYRRHISFDDSCKKDDGDEKSHTKVQVYVDPPSPDLGNTLRVQRINEIRRHSSHSPSLTVKEYEAEKDRRHSGVNPNTLGLDQEHMRFLSCSPAASRRISCGSLFKPNEPIGSSKSSLFAGSNLNFPFDRRSTDKEDKGKDESGGKDKAEKTKTFPIINPLVRSPHWPNITNGTGFISKCLLANADTLCAAVSPLMDPDETLNQGYYEKCVMNNYFGIGIDAKISLDFHMKREEHPEKCRSRAKNYMWYGVLGSKQLLQKTYKNLEQRVQLECDGQRIPLPSLQGIVILNIPSFMGGTNFWGGTKEDDSFLAPSFDDKVLEVVAVFGSVQMAASRCISLKHHRIAQCHSIQITILGDEGIPIQVDGEAWHQPPGIIRIIHKNRAQMLCRNRSLEYSLKTWQEKQRQHSISISREQTSNISDSTGISATSLPSGLMSERESYLLLNFIEIASSLVKWVKFLIISHPSLEHDLYAVACRTADALEAIHPQGKIVEGPNLRIQLAELITATRHLYEDSCNLLRERSQTLILREDLESKLSFALANTEMELRKCTVNKSSDGQMRASLNVLAPNEEPDTRKKSKPFWMRFRSNTTANNQSTINTVAQKSTASTRETVANWGVGEVVTWLETMQLGEYVETFTRNDVRGKELITLTRRDLKELGITKVGHVKRILQACRELNST